MPYNAEINRTNPSCFLFLIDQSGSMADSFGGGPGKSKAEGVADSINRLLQTLVLKCTKAEGVRDYYQVGVVGYGKSVGPILRLSQGTYPAGDGDSVPGKVASVPGLVPLGVLANSPLRIEQRTKHVDDGAGGFISQTVKFPVWFDPVASGPTPMCQAINQAWDILNDFLNRFPDSYPPLVINITDGEGTDGNPVEHTKVLHDLSSRDGNVLVFNLHISSKGEPTILFADRGEGLPDENARMLFNMSSVLPPGMVAIALREGFRVSELSRGFGFNADLVSLIRFLDIGTRVDARNLR